MNDLEVWAIEVKYEDIGFADWSVCKNGEREYAGSFEYVLGVLGRHLALYPFTAHEYRLRCLQTDEVIPGEIFA